MSGHAAVPQDRYWAWVGGHVALVIHAIGRHRLLFALTWAAVVGMSLALVAGLPKTWSVQTTIQISPTQVIADLSGGAAPPTGKQASVSSEYALETVLSRQNLIDLIRQTDLMEEWLKVRAPIPRLKDWVWARIFPPPTAEDRLDGFVTLLEKRFWVTGDQTTITIGILFPDPVLALKLVQGAQAKFLESRQTQEISTVADSIALLEKRASDAREALDASLKRLEEARKQRAVRVGRPRTATATGLSREAAPSRRGSQLLLEVEAKQRALANLTEARQRRVAELQARLEQLRAVYSETHPAVVETREALESVRRDSSQISALQQQLAPLEMEMQQRGLLSDVPLRAQREARPSALEATAVDLFDPMEDQDPEITYAKTDLLHAYARYNGLRDRVQGADLELDSARAAFKYRYVVIKPALPPREPTSPKRLLVIIASLLAGLVLAAFAPTLVDLTSRTFIEDWQVEQALGVPLLGTLPKI